MKKFIVFLLAFTMLQLISCFDELPTAEYNCSAAAFTESSDEREIRVYYPTVTGLENSDALNEQFKSAALAYMENYLTYNAPDGYYTYEIGTVIATLQHPDVVSFLCTGSLYVENTAHPASIVYTLNMDLRDGTFLEFSDLIGDFDVLAEQFENGEFSLVSGIGSLFDETNYADMIGQYDSTYGVYPEVYLLADDDDVLLAFSVDLVYTLGGHAEFAIDTDDVKKSLGAEITDILYN